jgi:hypothetical protein
LAIIGDDDDRSTGPTGWVTSGIGQTLRRDDHYRQWLRHVETRHIDSGPVDQYDGCLHKFDSGRLLYAGLQCRHFYITLKHSANFKTSGGADVSLMAGSFVPVCSDGSKWYQTAALLTPS